MNTKVKFVFLSDNHILWNKPKSRLDDTRNVGLKKLEYVLEFAKKENAIILQAGDFVDNERSWYLLPRLIELLRKYDVPIYLVRGQHDNYMYSEQTNPATTVGILEKSGLITVLNHKLTKVGFVNIFGINYGCDVSDIEETIFPNCFNILVIHAPISNEIPYYGAEYTDAKKFLKQQSKFKLILCGDIHRKFIVKSNNRFILNTGPMIRKEATEYNLKHKPGFFVFEIENNDGVLHYDAPLYEIIPHLNANEILSREEIEENERLTNLFDEFVSSIEEIEEEENDSEQTILEIMGRIIEKNKFEKRVVDILSEVMSESK